MTALRTRPRALIVHSQGTNRDHDLFEALELAGARPSIMLLDALLDAPEALADYPLLALPGGFSFGDALGAGRILGLRLRQALRPVLDQHIQRGRLILGICNGFQALIACELLGTLQGQAKVALLSNDSGRFESRWTQLEPEPQSKSLFVQGLDPFCCPVAHAEGRIWADEPSLDQFEAAGLVALRYRAQGPADYPANPNGSCRNIAGLCDPTGQILGLMPHPENHIFDWQRGPGVVGAQGLGLLKAGVSALRW